MTSRASTLFNGKTSNQTVCFTLPITCQICLSKVKEPCVCPNLHAFCSNCIDLWLEKTKQCPTCRVNIDKENPCRKILGGIENNDDADLIKPTDFSHPSTRKARYLNMFDQYENEISRLNNYIDSLHNEINKLKDSNENTIQANMIPGSFEQNEEIQGLKIKLVNLQNNFDEINKERDELKEQNKKLDSENSILIQDIARLKANLSEKNSQITSKYAVAALESKIEVYEKEIKQLQKALEKSDKYIAELEMRKDVKDKENKQNRPEEIISSNPSASFNCPTNVPCNAIPAKPSKIEALNLNRTDVKTVKFSEPSITSPTNSTQPPSAKKNVIINFYGSPSKTPNKTPNKTPVHSNATTHSSVPAVSSFGDRLKKNLFNAPNSGANSAFDFQAPNNLPQNSLHQASNILQSNSSNTTVNQQSNHNFLFSPMKRLRIEEPTIIEQFEARQLNDNAKSNTSDTRSSIQNVNESSDKTYATLEVCSNRLDTNQTASTSEGSYERYFRQFPNL